MGKKRLASVHVSAMKKMRVRVSMLTASTVDIIPVMKTSMYEVRSGIYHSSVIP